MRRSILKALFCFLFLITSYSYSQQYPIQLTAQLAPPFTGYLEDYSDDGLQKMRLLVLQTDLTEPSYDIKLKIKIEGQGIKIQSKSYYYAGPFNLQPGVPVMLSGSDLAGLLNVNNLDFAGISKNEYDKRKILPEGFYEICITAYDYNNPVPIQVSNAACAQGWMVHSDPPYLNLPQCGERLKTQNPQNILFQWTAMNLSSPNSAAVTEYEFSLFEIRPGGQNPNNIVQTIPPIYQTTVTIPIINYGITEPPLIKGMEYAWRVRAIDQSGRDYFKNNGYSAVCTFTYGSIYDDLFPLVLHAEPLSVRSAKFHWDNIANYNQYTVEYRKTGSEEYHWFSLNTINNTITTYDLEEKTEYMARLKGTMPDGHESEWSNVVTFVTPEKRPIACGDMPTAPPLPGTPLQAAAENMIWEVGQFEMIVTRLHNNTSFSGRYSGEGKIIIPFMGITLAVQFDNILVNEARTVVAGEVRAITKGIEQWEYDKELEEAEENAVYVDGIIDSVYYNNGQVCYTTKENSNPRCEPADTTGLTVIRDGEGNEYIVDADGTVQSKNYLEYSNDSLNASHDNLISFIYSPSQQWGFDAKTYPAFTEQYEVVKLKDSTNYFVPYKAIAEGKEDKVIAKLTFNPQPVTPSGVEGQNPEPASAGASAGTPDHSLVSFITQNLTKLNHTHTGNNEYEISVPHNAEAVYAYYNGQALGKLNITPLKALTKKLVIVPVGNTPLPIGEGLSSIYAQANITWEVSVTDKFNNTTWDVNKDGKLEGADANLFNKYSEEMRLLKSAYQKFDSTYDKKAYYIFVVTQFSNPDQKGYMVRNKAVGFVMASALVTPSSSGRAGEGLLAHELAHGAFGLEHTFPKAAVGTTDNLLDYGGGKHLVNSQWKIMHSALPQMSWLDDEEDGSSLATPCANINFDNQYFIAPNGFAFKMPAGGKIKKALSHLKGTVGTIAVGGKEYSASGFSLGITNFEGFKTTSGEALSLSYVKEANKVYYVFEENKSVKVYLLDKYYTDNEATTYELVDANSLFPYSFDCSAQNFVCSFPVTEQKPPVDKLASLKTKLTGIPVSGNTYIYEDGKLLTFTPDGKSDIKSFTQADANTLKNKIKQGDFTGDCSLFFEKTVAGYKTTIGYNKTITPKYGGPQELTNCATILEQKVNKYLEGKNDLAKTESAITTPSIADQGAISISAASIFKKIGQVVKTGKDIIVKAQLPEETWDKDNAEYNGSVIHLPSFAAGIGDGAIEEAKETVVLVAYGADLVFNADSRQKLVDGFKELTWDKIKDGVKEVAVNWADTYAQQNSKSYHQGGKDAVMVLTMISGVGVVKELADQAKGGLQSKADDIAEIVKRKADDFLNPFINGWTKEKILALPKGQRPNPSEYLSSEYITTHLAKFDGGATKITSYNPTGNIGPPSGTFVMPKKLADDLILQSGGDVKKLEKLLGLEEGYLGATPFRIDIESPSGLRMSDGNELGANEYWIPGGKTSGDIIEATVDQIKPEAYVSNSVYK